MRYKTLLSIGLGLGLALGSGAALAQDGPMTDTLTKPLGAEDAGKSGDKNKPSTQSKGTATDGSNKASFGALDINTDRKLSRDEVKSNTALSTDFDKLDSDRNGSLSNAEFAKFEDSGKDDKSAKDKAQDERDRGKARAQREGERTEDKLD